MGKKGKKRKTPKADVSASKTTSNIQLQKEQTSQQKKQEIQRVQSSPQKQQKSPGKTKKQSTLEETASTLKTTSNTSQEEQALRKEQEKESAQSSSQKQQILPEKTEKQSIQKAETRGPTPQRAWGQPLQLAQVSQQPRTQCSILLRPGLNRHQQQSSWGQPRQIAQGLSLAQVSQQQQPKTQGITSQHQQILYGPPQQQLVNISGTGSSKLITGKDNVIHNNTQEKQQSTSAQPMLAKTSQSADLKSDQLYLLSIPKRKNPEKAGTNGKSKIRVYTNMHEIIFDENFVTKATHYDVEITPNASKTVNREVFEKCRVRNFVNRHPAFDGKKNAYSANDLPFHSVMEDDIEIGDEKLERQRTFKICLKKVNDIDLSWIKNLRPGFDEADKEQSAIQALDIIMRHAPASRLLSIGRSLFWEKDNSKLLGGGLSLSCGGFSSAILGWKPYINIDVSHKPLPTSQKVIDLMIELTKEQNKPFSRVSEEIKKKWKKEKVEKYLKGLKVIYQIDQSHIKRVHRLNGLASIAVEQQFNYEGRMITVEEYFERVKHYKLQSPDLPCLKVTNKSGEIFLPAELCTIVANQFINRKLDEDQTRKMIALTTTDAPTRRKNIGNAFAKINVNASDTMKHEFHLSVHSESVEVDARVLSAPTLQYKEIVTVNEGRWGIQKFKKVSNLEKNTWTILNLSQSSQSFRYMSQPSQSYHDMSQSIDDFVKLLQQCAKEVGMVIEKPGFPYETIQLNLRDTRNITQYFRNQKTKNSKLIIVIIPNRKDETYGIVKRIAEHEGILTQCLRLMNLNKIVNIKNILLKINSKLNGINHTLNSVPQCLKNNDYMLVGADVTHPSPDSKNIPSIAAVAASCDDSAFRYDIRLKFQQPKQEIIFGLEEIITSQLKKTKHLPNKIIYYRDGVSEGQFLEVMQSEIEAIRRACEKHGIKNIQITCLIVQKRHHVRLFPRKGESKGKNGNVTAGTIVDTDITHPSHIDFYLVSHTSNLGTARPTKYRCLCNESNFTEDDIEEMTYYLCHMCARCTKAISYPAPTYYAHLAAARGRALIQGVKIDLKNLGAEQKRLQTSIKETSPMYFI